MRTTYVFIDYENVQPRSLTPLDADHFRVLVFVGASQSKLSFETAAALQKLGTRAEYVKITGNGSNALDFHIAFHIGRLSAEDPQAAFHIVSKDAGFDPLVQHLRERRVIAGRSPDLTDLRHHLEVREQTPAEMQATVVADLRRRRRSGLPRTLTALTNVIANLFRRQLSEVQLAAILAGLQAEGVIALNEAQVVFHLPVE